MAHLVNRKGYWSLEESYRDESGRPRKRRLAYYGKRAPDGTPERMAQMLDTAARLAEKIDAEQREMFGETASERRAREEEEAKFSPSQFLLDTQEVDAEGKEEDVQEPAADDAEVDFGEGGHSE